MSDRKVSVIVNTYNRPDLLAFTLTSLVTQSVLPAEILIADDGSGDETRKFIENFTSDSPIPIRHIWHEDDGFRRTLILNKAAKAATSEYLLFSDGDCVSDFRCVEKHLEFSRPDRFLTGRCVFLSQELSKKINIDLILKKKVGSKVLVPALLDKSKDTKRPEFGIALPYAITKLLDFLKPRDVNLWGSNFSCFKDSFAAVNGFNSSIVGWGREDIELGYRFENYGLTAFSMKNIAISWHLWHQHSPSRATYPKERHLETDKFKNGTEFRCEIGYDQA